MAQIRFRIDTVQTADADQPVQQCTTLAAMNLIMHGVEAPDIHYQDTMSQSFSTNFPQTSKNAFNLILANPPFTGSLDEEDIDSTLSAMVKTKKPNYCSWRVFCKC